jgi:microcin C transport system substrate-binding protein
MMKRMMNSGLLRLHDAMGCWLGTARRTASVVFAVAAAPALLAVCAATPMVAQAKPSISQ